VLIVERVTTRRGKRDRKEEALMPTYVALENWTDKGIRTVKDLSQRADSAGQLAQKHGCSLQLYWTMGPYDVVAIVEAPDDESASAFLLEVGSLGNVRTTTLRAYDREEMSSLLGRLG
jgi:uncharacterized protein with GYD domain